jgi:hypothetical protein
MGAKESLEDILQFVARASREADRNHERARYAKSRHEDGAPFVIRILIW